MKAGGGEGGWGKFHCYEILLGISFKILVLYDDPVTEYWP